MIIRRRYTANFTTIDNKLFDDVRLAADEVGILAYLRSRPHDWEVRRPALMRRWNMGRDAIKRVITSLVRTGWCRPERTRLANGTYYMIYEIRDEPGPTLTDEEVRRALSLVSGEAASDEIEGSHVASGDDPEPSDPPTKNPSWTGDHPALADPPPADPSLAYKDIPNKDLPNTDSTQKIEREHERAKQKHALNLVEFKRRWPTNANDDQTRVDNNWFSLSLEEGEAALAGIAPFLENQKRHGRKITPAGFTYLHQKRWALIEVKPEGTPLFTKYPRDSEEAKAVLVLLDLAGRMSALNFMRGPDGAISFGKAMTLQLLALAKAPPHREWIEINRRQGFAWEEWLRQFFDAGLMRKHLKEHDRAPWPWPPSAEGKIYATGPPEAQLSEQDMADFKS